MRKYKLILLLLLYCITGLSQDLDYAKFIIGKLSSPEFKGRGYVENGEQIESCLLVVNRNRKMLRYKIKHDL